MNNDMTSILSYIRCLSTPADREEIKLALRQAEIKTPPVNTDYILQRVKLLAGEEYRVGNRLNAIKITKELTGWGLKEAKEWCDVIFG